MDAAPNPPARMKEVPVTVSQGTAQSSADRLGLEEIVHLANRVGLEYVTARKEAELLDMMKNTVRARISIRIDDGSFSEAKLRRLMEIEPEYEEFLVKLVNARAEAEKLRIRYESYKNLFDARRSLLSYQKAEMKII
jgi:hypothetical protein